MYYDRNYVASKLRRWEKYLNDFRLPLWEEIPDLGLYMDQILVLLTQYLDYLPPEIKEEKVITASTVNNYVRIKAMPEPVKKKYYRVHIAYLIMICTLKQSLSISTLQKLIPMGISESEVKEIYSSYVAKHRATAQYFIKEVTAAASPIVHGDDESDASLKTSDLIAASAIAGGFARLMSEKLLLLEGETSAKAQTEGEGS